MSNRDPVDKLRQRQYKIAEKIMEAIEQIDALTKNINLQDSNIAAIEQIGGLQKVSRLQNSYIPREVSELVKANSDILDILESDVQSPEQKKRAQEILSLYDINKDTDDIVNHVLARANESAKDVVVEASAAGEISQSIAFELDEAASRRARNSPAKKSLEEAAEAFHKDAITLHDPHKLSLEECQALIKKYPPGSEIEQRAAEIANPIIITANDAAKAEASAQARAKAEKSAEGRVLAQKYKADREAKKLETEFEEVFSGLSKEEPVKPDSDNTENLDPALMEELSALVDELDSASADTGIQSESDSEEASPSPPRERSAGNRPPLPQARKARQRETSAEPGIDIQLEKALSDALDAAPAARKRVAGNPPPLPQAQKSRQRETAAQSGIDIQLEKALSDALDAAPAARKRAVGSTPESNQSPTQGVTLGMERARRIAQAVPETPEQKIQKMKSVIDDLKGVESHIVDPEQKKLLANIRNLVNDGKMPDANSIERLRKISQTVLATSDTSSVQKVAANKFQKDFPATETSKERKQPSAASPATQEDIVRRVNFSTQFITADKKHQASDAMKGAAPKEGQAVQPTNTGRGMGKV